MAACLSKVPLPALPSESQRRLFLEREIAELAGQIHAGTAALVERLAGIDELGDFAAAGFVSTAHWLSWRWGFSLPTSRESVRVARALRSLPGLRGAFGRGALSFAKVRALTRIATPENEDLLLDRAHDGTASQLARIVRLYRQQGREAAESQHARRELREWREEDGSVVIRVRLPAEQGALVLKAIEAAMMELEADGGVSAETSDPGLHMPGDGDSISHAGNDAPGISGCRCVGPAESSRRGAAPDRPPFEVRQADAFLRMVEAGPSPSGRLRCASATKMAPGLLVEPSRFDR